MLAEKDWKNIRVWIHSLADMQIVLYSDEINELVENGVFRNMVLWNDVYKFQKLLYKESIERLRATLSEEDR